MKISILITSYNLVDYIDDAISSVICQEFPCDWELLIGDDGSTDGTLEHINNWISKFPDNIQLITENRDGEEGKTGSRAARNRARLLEKASGDYINYLDGDDCWLGTVKLKEQLEMLENPRYKDCSCCAHNIEAFYIPKNACRIMVDETISTRTYSAKEYWPKQYFHTNTILFRKECKEMMLDSLYRDHLNDNFITYILLQYGKILYLNKVWARYNLTGEGLWTGKGPVYGRFRNLTLYDLERHIEPKLWLESFERHLGDFKIILKDYSPEKYKIVEPIVGNLPQDVFRVTRGLALKPDASLREKLARLVIILEYWLLRLCLKVHTIIKNI